MTKDEGGHLRVKRNSTKPEITNLGFQGWSSELLTTLECGHQRVKRNTAKPEIKNLGF